MLKKGERAKSTDKRLEHNKASAHARYKLLRSALKHPRKAPSELVKACDSQHTLAALDLSQHGIHPMSLNTLKAVADLVVEEGGWAALDSLRRQLREHVSQQGMNKGKPKSFTRKAQAEKIRKLRHQLELERRARIILTRAYTEALKMLHDTAKTDDTLANRLARHSATFGISSGFQVISGGMEDEH